MPRDDAVQNVLSLEEAHPVLLYEGELYNDDRLFILDFGVAEEAGKEIWCVVTRRNTRRFPPFRFDKFESESEVIDFIKKVEPSGGDLTNESV